MSGMKDWRPGLQPGQPPKCAVLLPPGLATAVLTSTVRPHHCSWADGSWSIHMRCTCHVQPAEKISITGEGHMGEGGPAHQPCNHPGCAHHNANATRHDATACPGLAALSGARM